MAVFKGMDLKVAVLGGGNWGTVLAQLLAERASEVRLWIRDEETARAVSATRQHPDAAPNMRLNERVRAITDLSQCFADEVPVIVWALPARSCRDVAREAATLFKGHEILLHATKGIEAGTLKRVSQVLREELPIRRVGVISGPNLSAEIARGEPAVTVVASPFAEVRQMGFELLNSARFRVVESEDLAGVEWAGALKNIFAIAAGAFDQLKLGSNARAWMLNRGLMEMQEIARSLSQREVEFATFLGPAGIGDLMATAASAQSRNYRVGWERAAGKSLDQILEQLGSVAEGVETARKIAVTSQLPIPLVRSIVEWLEGRIENSAFVEGALALDRNTRRW